MAHAFRPRPDGTLTCRLEGEERAIIAQVAQEVRELIRHDLQLQERPAPEAVQQAAQSDDPLQRLEAELAGAPSREPVDSAVQRLFPAASEDPQVAGEFRRFGQQALAEEKLEDLLRMIRMLDRPGSGREEVALGQEDVPVWLRGLNDMRLVLADRLSITRDGEFETLRMLQQIGEQVEDVPPVEDGDVAGGEIVAAVYELLTWLQESLLSALEHR